MDGQLVIDALFDFIIGWEHFVADDFDCELVGVVEVSGFEDFAVGSLAEEISQFVATDDSTHLHFSNSWSIFHRTSLI